MSLSNCPYFVLHKHLLSFVGLWPYQSKLKNRCFVSLYGIIIITTAIPIILGLMSDLEKDFMIFIETVIFIIVMCGGLRQILMYYRHRDLIRRLYKNIDDDWHMITDATELKILHKFSENGRILIWCYIATNYTVLFILFIINYLPLAIEPKLAHNYSKIFPYYSSEWIIEPSTDFGRNLQVITHGTIGFAVSTSAYVVTSATYICSVKHTCGMFAIIGFFTSNILTNRYRLPKVVQCNQITAFGKNKINNYNDPELFTIIKIHQKTLSRIHLIKDIFNRIFFLTQVFELICLGMLLFDLKYNISSPRSALRMLFSVLSISIHGFYINYGGEQIKHYSSEIHSSTYFASWYLTSTKIKKILLIIMLKTTRPEYFQTGIFLLSMDNFATILKASWSTATLLLAMHQKEE